VSAIRLAKNVDTVGVDFAAYRTGLERRLALLRELHGLAATQRTALTDGDVPALRTATAAREAAMEALLALEGELQSLQPAALAPVPVPAWVTDAHAEARALIASILEEDRQTQHAFEASESTRRQAAQVLEAAETTLAAYRKVVAPQPQAATLVDRRG
jgi:ribosomal 50S subunit-associated protein YjgA (DUF615 family)